MAMQKIPLTYDDYATGVHSLSLEEQLKLVELITANLRKKMEAGNDHADEDENDLTRFCGKWRDDRDAEEIVSMIYNERAKNIRSEKADL